MRTSLEKPSPAMIVACVALVLAIAGTAVAGSGNNSIGADELGKVVQRSKEKVVSVDEQDQAKAKCESDEQLLGGGATLPGADPAERPSIEQNGPINQRTWFAVANNDDSALNATLRVTALCLKK